MKNTPGCPKRELLVLNPERLTLSTGNRLIVSHDGLLANLSALYRVCKKDDLVVRAFLDIPVVSSIIIGLKEHVVDLVAYDIDTKHCIHHADIFVHTGLIGLALVHLGVITSSYVPNINRELRTAIYDLNSTRIERLILPPRFCEEGPIRDTNYYIQLSEDLIKILGGSKPHPWIDLSPVSPRTHTALVTLSAPSQNSLDDNPSLILNGALAIVYINLDLSLIYRSFTKSPPLQTVTWSS